MGALRLLSTARLLDAGRLDADPLDAGPQPTSGDGSATQTPGQMLDLAIDRCAAMEATYELAVGLATRAGLSRMPSEDGATGSERRSESADKDRLRADEIFSRLGVKQAVVTWSDPAIGGPLFAYRVTPTAD